MERPRRHLNILFGLAVFALAGVTAFVPIPARAASAVSCQQLVYSFASLLTGTQTVRQVAYTDGTWAWEISRFFGLKREVHVRQPDGIEIVYNRTNRTDTDLYSELLYPDEFLAIPKGARILDVGCGGGNFVQMQRARGVDAVGSDIVLSSWQRRHKHFVEAQANRLPFPDGEFHIVFSTWSFLAYEGGRQDPQGRRAVVDFLTELGRVTKPGGVIRLSPVPFQKYSDSEGQLQVRYPELEAALAEVPGVKIHRSPNTEWLSRQWYAPTIDPRDRGLRFDASVWIELIREQAGT